jgi:hypothetical protein
MLLDAFLVGMVCLRQLRAIVRAALKDFRASSGCHSHDYIIDAMLHDCRHIDCAELTELSSKDARSKMPQIPTSVMDRLPRVSFANDTSPHLY